MEKPSRIKQIAMIIAILLALAVSALAASYIVKAVMSPGAAAAPAK